MFGAIILTLAGVGAVAIVVTAAMAAWLLTWDHVTPNTSLLCALGSIRWSYAVAFFIAPTTLAGLSEGEPLLGFLLGSSFIAFMVAMAWWSGPI
ncbi:hypothetical protein HALG_00017 [Halorubrum virus CGphi46]|uniref:Uncharacterized protein n=1 Tax=Halorubrum virus CGphi46 TaxID=754066 RepID=R9TNS1_9CAUD|nr:hypothetical protein HALG_00017 [Halorubrum virus CGphi46]AGN33805.1 hypothetical protein HALG_00017 [Halorubrum virus CGphi46]